MSEGNGKKRPPEEPLVFEGTMAFHPEGRPDGEITIAKVTFRGRAFASSGTQYISRGTRFPSCIVLPSPTAATFGVDNS